MSFSLLLVFAATEFMLSLTPGPAVLTVVSQGIRHGARLSLRGAFGIIAGNAVYFLISAIGLGVVLVASEFLFNAIKFAGAAYLVFLGARMIIKSSSQAEQAHHVSDSTSSRQLFVQGLTTQLANPKAIIFFTALLPQFIDTNGNVAMQCLVLGVVSIGVELPVLVLYGWMAERGRNVLMNRRYARWIDRAAGMFLVGAGIKLALTRP